MSTLYFDLALRNKNKIKRISRITTKKKLIFKLYVANWAMIGKVCVQYWVFNIVFILYSFYKYSRMGFKDKEFTTAIVSIRFVGINRNCLEWKWIELNNSIERQIKIFIPSWTLGLKEFYLSTIKGIPKLKKLLFTIKP